MPLMFTPELTARVAAAAGAAPSLHNSQPWQFEAAGEELRLRGMSRRALPVSDPDARALYISCGAALFNARIALRVFGLDADVRRLPHPEYPHDVLAIIRATRGRAPERGDSRLYEAIWRRHTNRRPFSATRIQPVLVAGLQKAAKAENATLRLPGTRDTSAILRLAAWTGQELAASKAHQDELRRCIGHAAPDGIPVQALPARPLDGPSPVRAADFLAAGPPAHRAPVAYERHPQLAVLTTDHDEPHDWLSAGEALQHVLLVATLNGLSASFLYQIIEHDDMRQPAERSWPWPENPQMILRLGYGTPALPTPRRELADVVRSSDHFGLNG
jgi:hypothetical protein